MKRFGMILLVLCLAVSGIASAQTQTAPLRVLTGWAQQDYINLYPDRQLERIELAYDEQGRSNLPEVLLSGQWDIALVSTDQVSLSKLEDAGLLMDLGSIPELADKFINMLPSLESAVSKGEKRLALPAGLLYSQSMKLEMANVVKTNDKEIHVREKLGFTADNEPATFAELCDLAERYMALPTAARKGTVFDVDSSMGNAKNYFLHYLIELYIAQMTDQNGDVDFDTPLFRESLRPLERMAKALKKDNKISDQQGNGGAGKYGLVVDAGSHFIGSGRVLRIDEDDSRIAGRMKVIIINAHTTLTAEALDYCKLVLDMFSAEFVPLMYKTYDREALVRHMREQNLALAMERGLQEEIKLAQAGMQRTNDEDYYYSEAQIAEYRENIAPYLVFPTIPSMDTYVYAKDYAYGRLDADGLIQKLNAAVMEANQ